jgi:hypothetical protein
MYQLERDRPASSTHDILTTMSTLREAVQTADLPAILERLYPTCGARAGKRGRVKCVWRGGTDLSGALFQTRGGTWKLKDFVTGDTWDAFDVLTKLGGKTNAQAAAELTGERATAQTGKPPKPSVLEIHPPNLSDELLACLLWSRITKRPLWPHDPEQMTEQGRRCLELLAGWIRDSLAPITIRRRTDHRHRSPGGTMFKTEEAIAELEHAVEEVRLCNAAQLVAHQTAINAEVALERARAERILEGVPGVNAEARNAQLLVELESHHAELRTAQHAERMARLEYTHAVNLMNLAKYKVRAALSLNDPDDTD